MGYIYYFSSMALCANLLERFSKTKNARKSIPDIELITLSLIAQLVFQLGVRK